jgi:hypothetical protein
MVGKAAEIRSGQRRALSEKCVLRLDVEARIVLL